VHCSIQSNTRFQLIIDPSDDQSVMRLLFKFGLFKENATKMFVCSNLPGDIQGAVSILCDSTFNMLSKSVVPFSFREKKTLQNHDAGHDYS
jgi:hypothetical protein